MPERQTIGSGTPIGRYNLIEQRLYYLLILEGTDIPDPPLPFVTEISGPYASGFSPLAGNGPSDRVHKFAGPRHNAFDPSYVAVFDSFIYKYSHLFIADYRAVRGSALAIPPTRWTPAGAPQILTAREPEPIGDGFDSKILEDRRRKVLSSVVQRPGQNAFRMAIMRAYEGKGRITGCPEPETLEAAHIVPYSGPDSDHVCNGLLLRLDIHALFDAYLLTIAPDFRVRLAARLPARYYGFLEGKAVRLPRDLDLFPSVEALQCHQIAFDDRDRVDLIQRRPGDG